MSAATKAIRPQEHLDEAVAHITEDIVKRLGYDRDGRLPFIIVDVLECYEGFLEAKGLVGEFVAKSAKEDVTT